jgi:uncharacterized protein YggU (UPF0235/DUF167 family)
MKVDVLVKAGVKGAEKVVWNDNGSLTVWTHARAHDGEANKAVVEMLARYFGVAKSQAVITSGQRSRVKVVSILRGVLRG